MIFSQVLRDIDEEYTGYGGLGIDLLLECFGHVCKRFAKVRFSD
jgi:hypothetical protein